jgi:hypothetical protein
VGNCYHSVRETVEGIDSDNIDEFEAFVMDVLSDASQHAYDQRHIHPLTSLAGTHDSDPTPMAPQELPPLEAELPATRDTWE